MFVTRKHNTDHPSATPTPATYTFIFMRCYCNIHPAPDGATVPPLWTWAELPYLLNQQGRAELASQGILKTPQLPVILVTLTLGNQPRVVRKPELVRAETMCKQRYLQVMPASKYHVCHSLQLFQTKVQDTPEQRQAIPALPPF